MTLGESLLRALKEHGAKEVFGIPGDFALPFFKIMEESKILPLYTLGHEPAVGFAADATARINGSLGVAAVTYGAGAFNILNAVTCAYAEKSPLVVISGAPGAAEGQHGLLLHHQAKTLDSQLKIYMEITCDQTVLDDPSRAPEQIARVLRNCLEQSRPVYIQLPRDTVGADCGPVHAAPPTPVNKDAVAACADEILQRLDEAQSPLLLAGVELRRYGLEDKVTRLSRRLGLPVATSFMGRGLLSGPGTPLIGTYMGLAGDPEIMETVEGSDSLLLLGVILSDINFGVSAKHIDMRRAIVAVDRQVRMGHHIYPELPLSDLMDALLDRVSNRFDVNPRPRPAAPGGLVADDAPIIPKDIALGVNDMFDAHGRMPIASDMGDCLFTAMDIRQTDMVEPGYYATMGFGVPAGLGLQATTGQRPLILVGDGAFQMTGMELGHCSRYGWDPLVIVFNNEGWGMLRVFSPGDGYNDLGQWKFAQMAQVLGGDGYRVTTRKELGQALNTAASTRGRFQLIEVMLTPDAVSPALERYVNTLKNRTKPKD